jgi:hypothetical protein
MREAYWLSSIILTCYLIDQDGLTVIFSEDVAYLFGDWQKIRAERAETKTEQGRK